jgi:hypothetical protein
VDSGNDFDGGFNQSISSSAERVELFAAGKAPQRQLLGRYRRSVSGLGRSNT